MLAHLKSLVFAVGILPVLWVWACTDGGGTLTTAEIAMNAPAARGCADQQTARCTIGIEYAYPAADLLVLPEDAYF